MFPSVAWATDRPCTAVPWLSIPASRKYAVPDSDETRELELEIMRLTLGCIQIGCSGFGAELKSEIFRLTGGPSADQDVRRKHELACLRMAADCMQLVGDIQNPHLQRGFLELAKQLTDAAEAAEVPGLT
jgi:hypothetical protein